MLVNGVSALTKTRSARNSVRQEVGQERFMSSWSNHEKIHRESWSPHNTCQQHLDVKENISFIHLRVSVPTTLHTPVNAPSTYQPNSGDRPDQQINRRNVAYSHSFNQETQVLCDSQRTADLSGRGDKGYCSDHLSHTRLAQVPPDFGLEEQSIAYWMSPWDKCCKMRYGKRKGAKIKFSLFRLLVCGHRLHFPSH